MGQVCWQRRPVARASAGALACWFLASGCSPFTGVGSDKSSLRGDGGSEGAAGECVLRHPPERPDAAIKDGPSEPDLMFVAYRVDYGDQPAENGRRSYETTGFDLDGECTRDESGHACTVADWVEPSVYAVDGAGGIDNAIGTAFSIVSEGTWAASGVANAYAEAGLKSSLISVSGYNGQPDDPKVTVAYADVTLFRPASASNAKPTWQGTDEWLGIEAYFDTDRPIDEYGADDLPPFKYVDEAAFVTGGELVALIPEVDTTFGKYRRLQLRAKLTKHPTLDWMLQDGVGAVRTPVDTLLRVVGVSYAPRDASEVPNGSPVTRVCMDHPVYEERKRAICSLADISYEGPDQRGSLCDGASWGWRFDASLAKLVGLTAPLPVKLEDECPIGLQPGIDDHCGTSTNDGGAP